jgi:hypothetical protein
LISLRVAKEKDHNEDDSEDEDEDVGMLDVSDNEE